MISIIRSSPKFLSKKKYRTVWVRHVPLASKSLNPFLFLNFTLFLLTRKKEVKKTKQDLRPAKFAFAFGWFGYSFASRLKVRSGQSRRHGGAVFCQLFGLSIWDVLEDGALN